MERTVRRLGALACAVICGCSQGESGSVAEGDAGTGGPAKDGAASANGATNDAAVPLLDAYADAPVPAPDGNATVPDAGGPGDASTAAAFALPPANAPLDYQLGGAYAPPAGVQVVSRDRTASPAAGLYNICYINGFQVQPGEEASWDADLILRDANGKPIIDPDWNEQLLDVSTSAKRTRIAAKVGGWIDQCGKDGFKAVEVDNLDSYSRSTNRLTQQNAVDFIALLSARAHAQGLAIAQKNSSELLPRRADMGTDFAVVEECSRYSECQSFVDVYDKGVLMIEYRSADFAAGCGAFGATHSIVLRDVKLVPKGQSGYVYDGC